MAETYDKNLRTAIVKIREIIKDIIKDIRFHVRAEKILKAV